MIEILIVLLIMSVIAGAIVPLLNPSKVKKQNDSIISNHGVAECFYNNDGELYLWTIDNKDNKNCQLIIPSKTLNEFIKMSAFLEEESVKLYTEKTKLIIKSETTITVSRLLEGQFPKYNQLIPAESPKTAIINVAQMISALDRVSIMVNDKTSIVKLEFSENNLKLTADTPDSGKSEENLDIDYKAEELVIAFNYKYVLEALKNIDADEVKFGLNTSLSATVLKPNSEEDFVCLIMPVQIR